MDCNSSLVAVMYKQRSVLHYSGMMTYTTNKITTAWTLAHIIIKLWCYHFFPAPPEKLKLLLLNSCMTVYKHKI